MMEKLKSENSSTKVPISELLEQYIKNTKTGAIFHTLENSKNPSMIILRSKNVSQSVRKQQISQGIIDGIWVKPNEHEIRKHIVEENTFFEKLSTILVRRTIMTQLLLEMDTELAHYYFSDDKYMRGILERSQKQCERLIGDQYVKMYNANKDFLMNFMNGIDSLTTKLAKLELHEFLYVDKLLSNYLESPDKFTPDAIEMVKIDGDISNIDVEYKTIE